MENLRDPAKLAGRVMLALIFVIMWYGKIGGYDGTVGYMESKGCCRSSFCLNLAVVF